MKLLEGKTALITGAARGIGKAIALKFASEGANIAFTDLFIDEEHGGLATEREIAALGVKAKGYASNAADFAQTEEVVKKVQEDFGSIDILVNNAGITRDGLLVRMKDEDFDAVIDTNLKGVFYCTKAAAKIMMKKRSGRIVNMSSVVGLMGNAGQTNYAAAKAGVLGFSKSAAKELAARGVTVNMVAPGFIDTDMTAVLSDKVKETMVQEIPMRKMGRPEDVAGAVLFLVSDCSSYITGQVVNVDGGMVM